MTLELESELDIPCSPHFEAKMQRWEFHPLVALCDNDCHKGVQNMYYPCISRTHVNEIETEQEVVDGEGEEGGTNCNCALT